MDHCVRERDYMDYIESSMRFGRRLALWAHGLRCDRCRGDMRDWPKVKRLVRRAERLGAGRKVGLADRVMKGIGAIRPDGPASGGPPAEPLGKNHCPHAL